MSADPSLEVEALRARFDRDLADARSEAEVRGVRDRYLARKGGLVSGLLKALGQALRQAVAIAGEGRIAVGVDINATHHRAVTSGTVTGVATPIHLGSTITTYAVTITDEQDRPVCTARLTCLIRAASR